MLYLDDKLSRHPKILKAGELLGDSDGPGRALALFVDALTYTRTYLTNGFVPSSFVTGTPLVRNPTQVAAALTDVRLWHKTTGGYRFHDYFDWNKSRAEIKHERRKWREKKRRQRKKPNGRFTGKSRGMSPRDRVRDSRARARSTTTTTTTSTGTKPRSTGTGSSTVRVLTAHSVRGISIPPKTPTHRIVCAMLRAEFAADPSSLANAIEGVKRRCARQGFAYPDGARLDAAIQAVDRATRRKGAA